MNKIKELVIKYREIIVYIIVGGMTTVVSWAAFWLLSLVLDGNNSLQLFLNNTLSWVAGVLFAYPTNRKWVFRSTNPHIFKEFIEFTASRVSTWLIDAGLMALLVNVLHFNQFICKYLIVSVIVVVLNYVFSKLLVFKNKD